MLTGHSQGDMGIEFAVDHNVKFTAAVVESHIFRPAIGAVISDGEGEHRVSQALYRRHSAAVIGIGNDEAPLRHQICKGMEGVLHVCQIPEEIQMVRLYVQDHGHCGEEVQK